MTIVEIPATISCIVYLFTIAHKSFYQVKIIDGVT